MKKLKINSHIILEKIDKNNDLHINELFKLYNSRPDYHKISALNKITITKHKKFVKNHPYRFWFLIKLKNQYIGTLYLSYENNMGIYVGKSYEKVIKILVKKTTSKIKPIKGKLSIMQSYYTFNISTKNKNYSKIFTSMNYKKIQETFLIK